MPRCHDGMRPSPPRSPTQFCHRVRVVSSHHARVSVSKPWALASRSKMSSWCTSGPVQQSNQSSRIRVLQSMSRRRISLPGGFAKPREAKIEVNGARRGRSDEQMQWTSCAEQRARRARPMSLIPTQPICPSGLTLPMESGAVAAGTSQSHYLCISHFSFYFCMLFFTS
jgi:hypothetical protein